MYTNFYVFRYAAVLVIVVAVILSAAAVFLKPAQDATIAIAKMQGILAAANIDASAANAQELYAKYIIEELIISPEGNILSLYADSAFTQGDERAFYIDLKKELYNKSTGKEFKIPLYRADIEGKAVYIIPLLGKGLWGPIWGNIAFGEDLNTVLGATFDHKGETPGLGSEITEPFFTEQFIGKTIFDDDGNFTSLKVVKGGVVTMPADQQIHGVDAISGGTITSVGVSDMLADNLENYVEYIKKQQ